MLDMIDGWVVKMRGDKKIKTATQRIFPATMSAAGKEKWGTAPSATVDKVDFMEWSLNNQLADVYEEQKVVQTKVCSTHTGSPSIL